MSLNGGETRRLHRYTITSATAAAPAAAMPAPNSGPSSLPNSIIRASPALASTTTRSNGTTTPTPTTSQTSQTPTSPSATTIVKYEKSSCLFCNEWFDSQTFTEHLIHCGQVLEECPNSCHVFVPRIRMRTHLKECPRSKPTPTMKSAAVSTSGLPPPPIDTASVSEARLLGLEQDVNTLRSVLNEEIRQRLHLITDVGGLRKQHQIADDWTQGAEEALNALRKQLADENAQRVFEVEQCQNDFRYCYDIVQTLKTELQHEIESLQRHIGGASLSLVDHENQLNDNIMKLEETVLLHEKTNRDKFIEVEDFLGTLNNDLKTKFVANSDLNGKQVNLDYEVKSMKHIVCETEERCDKLEKLVTGLDQQVHQVVQTLSDLEHHLATQQRLASVQNSRGHLLWRIKDFSKKLEEARQYDTILHSAMFSNKPYGYALRLDLHLNGRGTWKGRNLLACLNVIAGEYDPLLAWPCRLQADVIIRDQSGLETGQEYVKTIQVRKKSDEFLQSNQYFHIPHKVIQTGNYLRNDCLFIEVKVLK